MVDFQGFSKSIAREAGELLVEHQDRGVAITHKSNDIDLVTTADRASEKLLASRIRDQFPDHLILGEEEGESGNPDSNLRWVIDPLDGTASARPASLEPSRRGQGSAERPLGLAHALSNSEKSHVRRLLGKEARKITFSTPFHGEGHFCRAVDTK
mgnify:CR=1 FL=1